MVVDALLHEFVSIELAWFPVPGMVSLLFSGSEAQIETVGHCQGICAITAPVELL